VTEPRFGGLRRLLRHPWLVQVVGTPMAIVIATAIGIYVFGWGPSVSPPAVGTHGVIQLTVDPVSLSISHDSPEVRVFASGLTPHGPVGEELDASSGVSIRGPGEADSTGNTTYTVALSTKLSQVDIGATYRITVVDEATGALALAYVRLTA
jgi:hypothetical protein